MSGQAGSRILKGHSGIGDTVTGEALVASDNFSARYDLDRLKGIFSRPAHKLYGQNYVDKILILTAAKGGVASAWMLKEMMSRDMSPKALILNFANPIMAQGAAYANLPMIVSVPAVGLTSTMSPVVTALVTSCSNRSIMGRFA